MSKEEREKKQHENFTHNKSIVFKDIALSYSAIFLKKYAHIFSLCLWAEISNEYFNSHSETEYIQLKKNSKLSKRKMDS